MTDKEALKLALEFIERVNKEGWILDDFEPQMYEAIAALKERLAQSEQEPVAWRDAAIRLGEELSSVGPDGYYNMNAKEWLDWAMAQNPSGKHSLPQRTEPICPECKAEVLYECVACSSNNYPPKRTEQEQKDEDWDEIFGNSLTIGAAIKNTEARIKENNQ